MSEKTNNTGKRNPNVICNVKRPTPGTVTNSNTQQAGNSRAGIFTNTRTNGGQKSGK